MSGDEASITTYLEMGEPQTPQVTPPLRSGMLLRIGEPVLPFYRYLREELGEALVGEDGTLLDRLADDGYDVYVLYLGGVPAAMFELDRRVATEVELVEFGMLRGFEGRGLDKYLLATAIETAWQHGPERVWATVDDHDDPRRILLLQWAGFIPYRTTGRRSD